VSRVARRIARQMRDAWVEGLASVRPSEQTHHAREVVGGRGSDYAGVADQWVCNRKKAYPNEDMARRVAASLNLKNATSGARDGFAGVVVVPYSCGRCGRWHLGR
jgi:hypothetical protein